MKKIALLVFVIIQSIAQTMGQATTNGLVAYYKFQGNTTDSITLSSAQSVTDVSIAADRFGVTNAAYAFNYTSKIISGQNVSITGNSDRTISLWFKVNENPTASKGNLVSWGDPYNTGTFFSVVYEPWQEMGYKFSINAQNRKYGFNMTGNLDLSTWHHLVVTYTTNLGSSTLYLDGIKLTGVEDTRFNTGTASLNTGASPLYIGNFWTENNGISGGLDEIRLYNRVLSTVEIQGIYSAEKVAYPIFADQPSSITVNSGQAATFSVTTTGSPAPTYQWIKDGSAISGATTNTLNLTSVTATSAGIYTVIAQNSFGSATSNSATLAVNYAPSITTNPISQVVIAGNSVTFSAVANGYPNPSYQWYKDGTILSGQRNSTLNITNTSSNDAGSYSVTASNSMGSATSSTALLTVYNAPSIVTQPISQSVTSGNNVSFSVTASGSATLTYQWYKDGLSISGANSSSYAITNVSSATAGTYTVTITNNYGSATSNGALLTVTTATVAPTISSQPNSTSVTSGNSASFTVSVSGTPPFSYQWRKDGLAINGANSSTYTINTTSPTDSGSYSVLVSNSVGSTLSNSAILAVTTNAPTITSQPSATSIIAGGTALFSVSVSGTSPFSYQWKKDGTPISGATSSTYIISGASTKDAGGYSVTVTNISGSVTSSAATLTVAAPKLSNLSVRTTLDANQIVIVGLTMSGGSKTALIRAGGPTLATFGVPNVMQDPKIELYNGSVKIDANDNWGGSAYLSTVFKSVGAFAYSSSSSLDAALVSTIDGGRTIQASGPSAGTVLVEAYDAGSGDNPRFTNISARNKVGTGANILIAGFTLEGSGTRNLLIRAVGPKLTDFGVPNVLADPKLEVYSGNSKIAENDNWASSLASTFASVGAFGLNTGSKDAAITVSLPAGGYTVQVSGADGGVGEAIVEIYELP